jgi:hypothetical protein
MEVAEWATQNGERGEAENSPARRATVEREDEEEK